MGVRRFGAMVLVVLGLATPSSAEAPAQPSSNVTLEGIFVVGGPIRGAVLEDGYLYVATLTSLAIYDVEVPGAPELLATRVSNRLVHGELISTGGDLLLLNGLATQGLDVWNVEDKSNPVLAGTVEGLPDEHFSCLLDCAWAYGSAGSIVDLRVPQRPDVHSLNWKVVAGLGEKYFHRLDEYRPGFMATAPRGGAPKILDVRDPLAPRVVATTRMPPINRSMFLYTEWARRGTDRFVLSSTENGACNDDFEGALVTFDTKGWPRDRTFEVAGRYRYPGRTEDESCLAYYFSPHPDFEDGGVVLLPNGMEGTRLVEVARNGKIREVGSFVLPTSDVWLAFWVDAEIFYALNATGEVYILRYDRG
ncbi:MAG TPA: hypothetical protein VHN37_14030 [Actinomycetota bacterium]|nr:hypothetical protein [Actinomycetota bacterium]